MNSETTNRSIGYALLIVGIILIAFPLIQSYLIFSGQSIPVEIFKNPTPLQLNQGVSQYDFQKQIENAFIKILPLDLINKTINLIIWAILMMIFVFGGKEISSIGVKMLKKEQ